MNKKLMKNRVSRTNTLEAMAYRCNCGCPNECNNCSGGGSWTETEHDNRMYSAVHGRTFVKSVR